MTVLDKWAQNSSLGWPGMIHCLKAWFITVPRKASLTKQVLLPNAIMATSRSWKHSIPTLQEEVKVKSQCLAGAWQGSSVGKVFAYHGWLCPWLDALSCRDWGWQCTVVIPGWEPGSRTIRRSRQSLGAQPACGQAGYHPPKKNPKSPLYKVSACQNYPRQIFWIVQNVQSTFTGMAHCLLCCNCHPPSLIEIRVFPRVLGGYTY